MHILCCANAPRALGSSPSGFTTRETKVHVVCESKLDNWRSRLVCLGTILAEPAKFIPRYLVEKSGHNSKKVLILSIHKLIFFIHRIEWDRSNFFKNYKVIIQWTLYYFGVLASWEKKPSYNDGRNTNGAGSCLRPFRGLADEVWVNQNWKLC